MTSYAKSSSDTAANKTTSDNQQSSQPQQQQTTVTTISEAPPASYSEELRSIFSCNDADQQVVSPSQRRPKRMLSQAEQTIIETINTCLRNWHQPWKQTFLEDGREFHAVYDLMEGLLHYEYQITSSSDTELSSERTLAISQAVSRLIDYGNAVLGIDLVIRANDDAFSETDPLRMTTIELFQAHLKAHQLREKLLYDYFKKDKPQQQQLPQPQLNIHNNGAFVNDQQQPQPDQNGAPQSPSTTPNHLQVPRGSCYSLHSLAIDVHKSGKSPRGSVTSINSLAAPDMSGRRTPNSQGLPSPRDGPDMDAAELSQSVEITHMLATIKSRTFSSGPSSTTRLTLLPGVLAKIETLLAAPSTHSSKISQCFELLDALLDSIERLPDESRDKEVIMISTTLLRHLVRKVYVYDPTERDNGDSSAHFQHAHWTTCLLSLVRLMGPRFNSYLKQFNNLADMGAFLTDYLFVVKRLLLSSSIGYSSRSSASKTSSSNFETFSKDMDLVSSPIYPECWIEMTLLACSTFLSSLTSLFQVMRQVFSSNQPMWLAFIDCLVHFPLHESLAVNRLLIKERQKLLADDIRRTAAEYVWISWESLSLSQKQQLLEDLMEPLLRASIALHSKHRSVLLPIFYDMMRCDYTVQYITPRRCSFSGGHTSMMMMSPRQNPHQFDRESGRRQSSAVYQSHVGDISLPYLSLPQQQHDGIKRSDDGTVLRKFTHLIVMKLNTLILDLKLGDESFTRELCAALSGNLNPKYHQTHTMVSGSPAAAYGDTSQFKSMARQTADLIGEFLQICMDCRHATRLVYKHLSLLCRFKLILFFRDKVDRPELYLNNLYLLSHLHHVAQRYVEAGYTLLEHAKSLIWSTGKPLENHYRVVLKFFNISQQQLQDSASLKIFLYNTIMEYFDQGQNWEAAVPLCRELCQYYEFKTYDYAKLAQQLAKMSSYYNQISDTLSRKNPEYFRVTFYGCGFPSCLKDMTVIYRGRAYEKLADFQATILSKYPDARPLSTLSKPDASLLADPEARYLQINACSPVVDLQSKFPGVELGKIRETLLQYYRHNCCDKFQFSRRVSRQAPLSSNGAVEAANADAGDNAFANMWRERTTLTTNTFPGMLPFFPVYLIETRIISPIESAIEDLERINDRLASMVNRFRADDERHQEDVRLLGQLLLGVVDAAVNGGISKYEEAFFQQPVPAQSSPATTTLGNASKLMTNQSANSVAASGHQTSPSKAIVVHASSTNDSSVTAHTNNSGQQHQDQMENHQRQMQRQNAPLDCGNSVQVASDRRASSMAVGTGTERPEVNKLKHLIARQVPLLDEAIQLHRDRVAEVMRPQHEHLESSYKKLKHYILTKYHRYLPHDYNSTGGGASSGGGGGGSGISSKGLGWSSGGSQTALRSYRSMTRSPRSTQRISATAAAAAAAASAVATEQQQQQPADLHTDTDCPI